jgi:hypothetical protein
MPAAYTTTTSPRTSASLRVSKLRNRGNHQKA